MSRPLAGAAALALATVALHAAAFRLAADGGGAWPDDTLYLYEAKVLASGSVTVAAPPEGEAFRVPGVTEHAGRWFGKYYPGIPALLAPFERAGVPWLLNPLAAGALVLGTFLLGRAMATPGAGLAAAVLLAVSPVLFRLATTYLSHVACAALLVYAAVAVATARRGAAPARWGLLAGTLWCGALLSRPLTAMALAIPFAVVGVRDLIGAPGRRAWVPGFAIAALAGAAALLAWNAALTGDPLLSAYSISKPRDAFGFGHAVGGGRAMRAVIYTPAVALETLEAQLRAAANTILAVPLPGYAAAVLALPAIAGAFLRGIRGRAALLVLAPLVLVAVHFFYPGTRGVSATALGPRYYFEGLPAYFLLATLAASAAVRGRPRAGAAARALLVLLAVASAGFALPAEVSRLRAAHANPMSGQTHRLEAALAELPPARRVVFVDISTYSEMAALLANRPDLANDDLVAIYRQPHQNRAVLDAYPGREALLFRWSAKLGPAFEPYVPEQDRSGPPRGFPYSGPAGMRFPPRAADGPDTAASG